MLCLQILYSQVASNTLGPRVKKAQYVGYTDATFATKSVHSPERGLLGPLISAEVSKAPLSPLALPLITWPSVSSSCVLLQ